MEQLAILNNVAGLTAEQQEAAAMHFEIVQAAKTAVNSLLDLGRKLKRMRDSGRYKDLGFASFAEYTEAAVGIKQRQAYNYIQVVESLPARLIEENAAAGVTKLALLAKLNPEEREDLTGEALANITVGACTAIPRNCGRVRTIWTLSTEPCCKAISSRPATSCPRKSWKN